MEKNIFIEGLKLEDDKRKNVVKQVKEFEVRDSDVFLIGYPKSGTTWAQEMIWLILNNLNYEGAKAHVDERFPLLEMFGTVGSTLLITKKCHTHSIEFANALKDPRCMKTHFKWDYLPEQILNNSKRPKIIYISRNPKDVCVSSYYFFKNMVKSTDYSWGDFTDGFLHSYIAKSIGFYWDHVLSYWKFKDQPNFLFIKYEDMKNNLSDTIQKVAKFLGKCVSKEEEVKLIKWLDFETMKHNPAVNRENDYDSSEFLRKGKVGEHKNIMSEEMIKKFDLWIKKNLEGTDFKL